MTPATNQIYLSTPPIDSDGNVQSAQTRRVTSGAGIRPPVFQVDDVVVDLLNRELTGQPKESYITTLISTTDSSADVISTYRLELSKRAKNGLYDNAPTGILKDRRKTNKTSLAEKLDYDCYQLHQFINYNINDVSDLYRKATTTPSTRTLSESTSCTQQQDNSELFLVKETLATLQSDILSLKRSVHDSNNKMDFLCAEL